jgi:hypothetical protein
VQLIIPYVLAPTPHANTLSIGISGCLTVGMLIASFMVSPLRVPLRYALRVIGAMQLSSLLFFFYFPKDFPYSMTDYLSAIITMDLVFIVIIPWILGTTYFVFDFKLYQKFLAYFMVITYFLIEVPFHIFFHALVLQYSTMVIAPVLYAIFGLSLQVFLFMALYSWAMSWE